jgi:GTP-binding protein
LLKIKNVDFYTSFANISLMPDKDIPEIAFVGRSNVGKSSLLNDLANKKIAQTSSTPGKTRLINFFLVNKSFYFVDLPGYGYAKVAKSQKRDWGDFIEKYLETRTQLKVIIFLLDIRRIPNEQDKILNNWFKELEDLKIFYMLTKSDKLSSNERNKQKIKIALELFVDQKDFILYSIPKKIGKLELLNRLEFLEK